MGRVKKFIEESRIEFKKIIWPSQQTVSSSIVIVLLSTAIMSLFFGFVDFFLLKIFSLVF